MLNECNSFKWYEKTKFELFFALANHLTFFLYYSPKTTFQCHKLQNQSCSGSIRLMINNIVRKQTIVYDNCFIEKGVYFRGNNILENLERKHKTQSYRINIPLTFKFTFFIIYEQFDNIEKYSYSILQNYLP